MKTSRVVSLAAAPLGIYLLATWIVGAKVQTALEEQYKLVEALPYVKVVERKYDRGLFGATETATFEIMGDMFRALQKAQKEAAAADPDAAKANPASLEPLRFTVRSSIKHGPLPGLSTVAAATAESELVLDDKTMQELRSLLGDAKPLTASAVYRFDGGGTSTISSPAFAMTLPSGEGAGTGKLSWQGFNARLDFSRGLASYRMTGDAPRLQIVDDKGGGMTMAGLKLEADLQRMFEDDPMLYSGTQRFTIAQMDVVPPKEVENTTPVAFKQVAVDVGMPRNGEFVDLIERIGAEVVQIGDTDYGPGRFEISFRHLHARTVSTLYREMMKLYSNPAVFTAEADPRQALAPLAGPAMELLKHDPEFRIDRVSFKSGQGEAKVSANLRLKNPKPEEFSNPLMLLGKLEAAADIALPESMLASFAPGPGMAGGPGEGSEPDAEAQAMRARMMEQQLAGLAEQGYVARAEGMVKSKIEFRNGQLTVNGKPFSPMALGGGRPMPPDVAQPVEPPAAQVR